MEPISFDKKKKITVKKVDGVKYSMVNLKGHGIMTDFVNAELRPTGAIPRPVANATLAPTAAEAAKEYGGGPNRKN